MDLYIQNKYCPCTRCRMAKMMLPILLVSLGTMSLVDEFFGMRGGTIVAMMLIVFGGVRLVQSSASTEGHRAPGELPATAIPPVPSETATAQNSEAQNG
jgi:hypothetical protein